MTVLNRLWCRLGRHRWVYFVDGSICRVCHHCREVEYDLPTVSYIDPGPTIDDPGPNPPPYILAHQAGDHTNCPPAECTVAERATFGGGS